jgi:hypothetical protein
LLFRLAGTREVSEQLAGILGRAQFLTGVDVEHAAGVATCQYRAGQRTMRAEAEELLRAGSLLATVDPARRVRIYPQPPKAAAPGCCYTLLPGGRLRGPHGESLLPGAAVVGVWLDVHGAGWLADVGWIGAPSPVFLERCVVDGRTGTLSLEARRAGPPADDLLATVRTEGLGGW